MEGRYPKTFLDRYATFATVIEPQSELEVIEEDPDDNRFLECAIAGGASYIITGDNHLLELKEYQDIVILPPVGFLALLEAKKALKKSNRLFCLGEGKATSLRRTNGVRRMFALHT